MPVYTYRREDGTTFDFRQKFLDEPLTIDPETGQRVVRVVQPTSVIFKGSGFYVTDSKSGSKSSTSSPAKSGDSKESTTASTTTESKESAAPKKEPSAASAAAD
jgi:predicted nucleic acid-binding Zn ribbon protein